MYLFCSYGIWKQAGAAGLVEDTLTSDNCGGGGATIELGKKGAVHFPHAQLTVGLLGGSLALAKMGESNNPEHVTSSSCGPCVGT